MIIGYNSLPAFDQAATDLRFLDELDRLLQAGAFDSYKEACGAMGISASRISEIGVGRYHCNLKMLYRLVQHYPTADFPFILFGSAVSARPEPTQAPERAQGRRW